MSQFSTIEEMSLDGFQIVNSNMFIHIPRNSDPTCTVWPTRISFNKLTLEKLNFCEYVKIQVNPKTKCLLVMPVSSSDKDSIRWTIMAEMQCWNTTCSYRVPGVILPQQKICIYHLDQAERIRPM